MFCGATEHLARHHVAVGTKSLIGVGSGAWRRILGWKKSKHRAAVLHELSQTVPLCQGCHAVVHHAGAHTILWGFVGTIAYTPAGVFFIPQGARAPVFMSVDELRREVLRGVWLSLGGNGDGRSLG